MEFKWDGPVTWDTQVVEYTGWHPDIPCRAVLRIPRGARKAPAILCLHGHERGLALGKEVTGHFAEPLAAAGFVTLSPDAFCSGDRRNKEYDWIEFDHWKGAACFHERLESQELMLGGNSLMGLHIWELTRAVDLLRSLPFVDKRLIGSVGSSQGGVHTWWLTALDTRVTAAVSSAGIATYAALIKQHIVHAFYYTVPGILAIADQPEIISLAAPRPLLALNCELDGSFPIESAKTVGRHVAKAYKELGAAERFREVNQPIDHSFPPEAVKMAVEWFVRWLKEA